MMDHPPPFSDGGQPESYTSGLLPGSGEQSSSMSDFTSEMDPFLTLPPTAQEPQQPLSEADSLRQAPVHPPNPPPPHEPQQQQTQDHNSSKHQGFSNTSAPMNASAQSQDHQVQRHVQGNRHQHLLYTPPPPGEEFDRFSYGESPTCGSGTSNNSNFSPASPAGTWPSPATSFQQPSDLWHVPESWGGVRASTPASVGNCASPDFSPNSAYPEPLDLRNGWTIEPLRSLTPIAGMDALAASSCPASPTGLPTSAYMMRANDSPASPYGMDMLSTRASEPPMEPSTSAASAKQEVPYAQLIYKALKDSKDHSMSLQDLYTWFQENTDKCKPGQRGWMNSIRHNLSMNAGFTKCDRKRNQDSMTPEIEDVQSNSDPKKSTEWTLTDDAIENGIQSTTRYRNKKNDKDRDRQYYPQDSHSYRHGIAANRLASSHNREFPSRVTKPYQRGYGPRAPTSGYFARTTSPHGQWYSQALFDQATSQGKNIKAEPGLSTLPSSTEPDSYGLMMPDHQMMHGNVPFEMPANSSQSMYPVGGPPQPTTHPFPFGTSDVQLAYPGGGDSVVDANRFGTPVPADMSHGIYWPDSNEHGY